MAKLPEWSQIDGTQVKKEGCPGGVPWGLFPAPSWDAPGRKHGAGTDGLLVPSGVVWEWGTAQKSSLDL